MQRQSRIPKSQCLGRGAAFSPRNNSTASFSSSGNTSTTSFSSSGKSSTTSSSSSGNTSRTSFPSSGESSVYGSWTSLGSGNTSNSSNSSEASLACDRTATSATNYNHDNRTLDTRKVGDGHHIEIDGHRKTKTPVFSDKEIDDGGNERRKSARLPIRRLLEKTFAKPNTSSLGRSDRGNKFPRLLNLNFASSRGRDTELSKPVESRGHPLGARGSRVPLPRKFKRPPLPFRAL